MRRKRALVAVLAAAQATTGLLAVALGRDGAAPARAYPAGHVDLAGHGFGHGRGLGQYGALGYAIDHGRTYQQILDHYYGGTVLAGDLGNPSISVRLTARDGQPMVVTQERGHMATNVDAGPFGGVMVTREGSKYRLYRTSDGSSRCDGGPAPGWTFVSESDSPITASPTSNTTSFVAYGAPSDEQRKEMLQLCRADGTRWYRGTLQAVVDGGGVLRTVNHLPTDSYLVGVVPRESPASWGSLGGGAGMHALRAQAVAARSYATAENRLPGVAKTCDTISCQVYAGRAEQLAGAGYKDLEGVPTYASTDQAVKDTSGQVRRAGGAVARTEFSSSTGGWTAGGTFPAVPDEGDDTSSNPNHDWTARVPVTSIEAKFGKGTLVDVQVTERNGLGADGGRVRTVRLTFSGGTVDRTGNQFRSDFGLKSDWFRLANAAVPGYHTLSRDGGVFSFGTARFAGSLPGLGVSTPARDVAAAPGGGYWVLADDGGVFTFGGAHFHGSLGGERLNGPPRQLVTTPSGQGYWIVADDGGVFTFGDAGFFGSTGGMPLNAPVVGMTPTPAGGGYWLVARDGGVFSFGDAVFHGSTGGLRLNRPVNDIAARPDGQGYWLLAEDGGLFAFGTATFFGSLPGRTVVETAVDLDASPTGEGYLVATAEGGVHAFGDTGFLGSPASVGARAATVALSIPR